MAENSNRSLRISGCLLLAAVVLGIGLFSGLAALGLVGPDEPRYAWIARHMAQSGNWITPILYGKPWFEKPILFYWAAGVGFKFLASPEWAARLPSALAAFTAGLSMAWLGWRRYGLATACAVLLIFPTCIGVVAFARAATPDMLFTASLALALCCAEPALVKRGALGSVHRPGTESDKRNLIFLGVWLGLAVLAKGPAAILLAGGSTCLWALLTGRWRSVIRLLHPLAILFFCAVALPWYVLCAYWNPGFFHSFIVLNNFQRFLTPVFHHRQPFWFFAPILLLGALPWTALLAGPLLDARRIWREASWRNSSGLFIACWAIFPVIFFSFSESKLPEYILPIFPPLTLLLARSFVRAIREAPRVARGMGISTGMLWLILCSAGAHWLDRLPDYASERAEMHHLRILLLGVGICAATILILASAVRRHGLVLALSSLLVVGLIEFTNRRVLPRFDPYLSARALAHGMSQIPSAHPLPILSLDANRGCAYGLRFYRPGIQLEARRPKESLASQLSGFPLLLVSGRGAVEPPGLGPAMHPRFVVGFPPYCWVESVEPPKHGRK